MFALGIALWGLMGVAAGLLASRVRAGSGRPIGRTVLWAVFGALLGGLAGAFAYVPGIAFAWYPWELVGAAAVGLGAGLASRLGRRSGTRTAWRMLRGGALVAGTLLVGIFAWFLLARVNPRTFAPRADAHPDASLAGYPCDTTVLRARMTELARRFVARPGNAGIVVGASVAGRRVVVPAGVTALSGRRTPVDRQSQFEVGSITKVFTGIALAQAVVAGEVRLDERVGALVSRDPRWRRADASVRDMPVTLQDLATHSAGLPSSPPALPFLAALTSDNLYGGLSREQLLQSVAVSAGALPARRSYHYSNFGFVLLADLLKGASGMSYPRLLRERVLQPLGMTHTQVVEGDVVPAGLVQGHSMGLPMPHWVGHEFAGADGVISTADDLLTLGEAYSSPPSGPMGEALRVAAVEYAPEAREGIRMGLGWHIARAGDSSRIIFHRGKTLGFVAYLAVMPERRIAVVVLANSTDGTAPWIGARLREALVRATASGTACPAPSAGRA